ncbi:MAG: hypothetical protein AAF918_16135 [Pseudomonadota bacterium]
MKDQSNTPRTSETELTPQPEKRFHGWRLIGIILIVMVVLAVISAVVDWMVIGPLEGRAPWL